jgi:hypothetical protein
VYVFQVIPVSVASVAVPPKLRCSHCDVAMVSKMALKMHLANNHLRETLARYVPMLTSLIHIVCVEQKGF